MKSTTANPQDNESGGLLKKLRSGLQWGKQRLRKDIRELLGRGRWNDDDREALEERLLQADVGIAATTWLIDQLDAQSSAADSGFADGLKVIEDSVLSLLQSVEEPLTIPKEPTPFVMLVVGVNGTGKTTTIGKLARRFAKDGHSVLLAAGDTFRAAAVEQLSMWGERTGSTVVAQSHGADPAAVIFDALSSARARNVDIVIADTAGRLHTAGGLMDELKKIKRVMSKIDESVPHETLLVLDASQGQNALVQAREFHEALGLTGLAVTKLDGTAKGGILLAIAKELGLPVRYVGTGEGADDIDAFDARAYTDALLGEPAT
jgi:fused signal recognition particle receptor